MTKAQIIDEYNSLTATINEEVSNYKSVTGRDWCGTSRLGNMGGNAISYSKDELERLLIMRKSSIYSIREAVENWEKTEALKSTEEGRAFIQSLDARLNVLTDDKNRLAEEMVSEFNSLLERIGMTDWQMVPYRVHKVFPSLNRVTFSISKRIYCDLSVGIEYHKGEVKMEVSSSLKCERNYIGTEHDQYEQYKGYVVICENAETINEWLNTKYRTMASKVYDLDDEIGKVKEMIESPADYYKA